MKVRFHLKVNTYLETFYNDFKREHMVFPGMVYISHPTEYGTLYSKEELRNLSEVCKEHHIPLFMDGARLGYGLMSNETDVTIEDIANYCDIFILVVQRLVHYVVKRLYLQTIMNLNTSLHVLNSMVPY